MKRNLLNRMADKKLTQIDIRKRPVLHLIDKDAAAVKGATYGKPVALSIEGRVTGVGHKGKFHRREVTVEIDKVTGRGVKDQDNDND